MRSTPRGPAHWAWGQVGILQDADASLVERVLTELRRKLPDGDALLWAEPEGDDPDLPPLVLLTMAVPR